MTATDMGSILQTLQDDPDNRTRFDEQWTQGRSAFGGLSAAFAVTAMSKALGQDLPMRSLMVSFIGPIPPGEVSVTTRCLRQGRNVTQMQADVLVGDEVCLQAMGVFGHAREGLVVPARRMEKPVPREQGLHIVAHRKRLPAFLGQFDGYWVSDGLPFSGKPSRELNLWARHEGDMTRFPAERLVAIADIPPPVILSYYDSPSVPASSLTWSLEFVKPPQAVTADWFYLEFTAEAAAEGYTQQSGRIFEESGELCALSRQCMVYFEPPKTGAAD